MMNKSKALKLSSDADELPLPALDADLTLGELEENTPAARQSLFLAWSNAGHDTDVPPDTGRRRESVALSSARSVEGWDTGFWLLHDLSARRKGWARLNEMRYGLRSFHVSSRPWYAAVKRTADAMLSLFLLILLLPLFALTAAAVKLDSPGPVFFRQRRIGKDGRAFPIWKFRSMYTDAPRYAASPTSNQDRRLTRIGQLIRRFSVDELPQLINVLRGEMSLVGPRPEMPFIVERYTAVERQRLVVKPGITGLWQVSPARAFPIHENLQYDLHYIRHQNLMLDGVILIRTIASVLHGAGAV
jgi:lipopolysaccharide/colanic/teichoic acid biosynthesis glycosyltransferase